MSRLPTIDDRLLLILKEDGGRSLEVSAFDKDSSTHFVRKGYWQILESQTGVRASQWRAFASGNQRSTPDMIEAAARFWPQYAFWIATGITDATNGHIAPSLVTNFPEFTWMPDPISTQYFQHSLKLQNQWIAQAKTGRFIERLQLDGKMLGSKGLDVAYSLCETEEYVALREKWKEREKLRAEKNPPAKKSSPSDPRSEHQDKRDLFYKPKPSE